METKLSQEYIDNNPSNIFSLYQWKQGKDGKIHFLNINNPNQIENIKKENNSINTQINITKPSKLERTTRIYDNTEKYKLESFVVTEWGLAKITKKENQIISVTIDGNPAEIPESQIKLNYCVNVLVLINESSYLLDLKVDPSTSINDFKKKIAEFVNSHSSLIVLIHGGKKVEEPKNIVDLGIYDRDSFMALVKDPSENIMSRLGNSILNSKFNNNFNAIKFKCDEDIIINALGLYRNEAADIYYDLMIYEEDEGNPHLVYNEKKVVVLKKSEKSEEIFKYNISHINIKKNKIYQIHENILSNDNSSQYSGFGLQKNVSTKKAIINFEFFDCNLNSKLNGTNCEKGLIPMFYFYIKTEEI